MATTSISNTSTISGTIDTCDISVETNEVVVTLIDGITAVKSASTDCWTSGELTYTIVITNDASNPDLTDGIFTDTLDASITLASVTDPVLVDGVSTSYTFSNNVLTIDPLPTITAGSSVTVTIIVEQA